MTLSMSAAPIGRAKLRHNASCSSTQVVNQPKSVRLPATSQDIVTKPGSPTS